MRKYLVVVDMQNDFIDGPLGSNEAKAVIPRVIERILDAKAENRIVLFTQDTHSESYLDSSEGRHLPVPHCIIGTEGWELHKEIAPYAEVIVQKPTFGSLQLAESLDGEAGGQNLDIALCGVCTDICVVSNALLLRAFFPEATLRVYADACAGVTPDSHEAALVILRACHVDVTEGA